MQSLPIDSVIPELLLALRQAGAVVLQAPPGAGKTTRVPPAIAGEKSGRVIVLEPRRVAARAAASRIAEERGWRLGEEVGYQIRMERRFSSRTRVLVVTEGILTRMLQDDPFLEGVDALVFDEFHERSLHTDLALAMARKVKLEARPDLGLVVMSATLSPEPIAAYLGGCPIVRSEGRLHPVQIVYMERTESRPIHELAAEGVRRAWSLGSGGVLCFLPGAGEIRRTAEALEAWAPGPVQPLYGDLPLEKQAAVLRPGAERRIVLSTNVAETSVTVDGIEAVVDTGWARVPKQDAGTGLDRLELTRVSQASADQRAGRAGRQGPGICLRLWPAAEQRGLLERETPEIRRVDLSGAVLELLCWGETDLEGFEWFEAPEPSSLARARELLRALGAVEAGRMTPMGRAMARLPIQPRLARLILEGERLGVRADAALVAAMLSERDAVRLTGRWSSNSDVLDRWEALRAFEAGQPGPWEIQQAPARQVLRARDQLLGLLGSDVSASRAGRKKTMGSEGEALSRALLAAFPDRLARRREALSPRAVLVGGRGVRLAEESSVRTSELFLGIDIDGGRRGELAEALVRMASGVERAWLPEASLGRRESVVFEEAGERVVGRQAVLYLDLVLEERQVAQPDRLLAAAALEEAAGARLDRVLPLEQESFTSFRDRGRCLASWMPELKLPSFDDADLAGMLGDLCHGARSFADLRRAPWLALLRSRLTYRQQEALEREAPERVEVPSGSHIRLQYSTEGPPVLAVRIQEVFGLADTPRVAGGRVAVVLHLLAPNGRPQQVTQDLRSFWNGAYQEVRKELRGRYPKHAWPDDPWNAPPQRRPTRRPS